MYLRKINLVAAATLALAPVVSQASPEKDALNACSRAFAESLASPGAAAPTYKVVFRGDSGTGTVSQFFVRSYSFYLHANDPKTGAAIARATCSTNSMGAVAAFTVVPADAPYPSFASQN